MHFFDKIHINSFKGLKNVELEKVRDLNLIFSYGNFGKTSFLEALKIMAEPLSLCRSYNYFLKKYDKKAFSLYKSLFFKNKKAEFSWSVNGIDFYDRLIGDISEDGIFEGYQFYQFGSELFGIKDIFGKEIAVSENQPLFEVKEDFGEIDWNYYDCLLWNEEKNFSGFKDNDFKQYILNFIKYYNEDVTNIFVDNHKNIMVNTKNEGYIPAKNLGSFLYSAAVMHKFLENCDNSVLLIDNFDFMLNEKCAEEYINTFLGSVEEKNCLKFVVLKTDFALRAFIDILSRNRRLSNLTLTILDKNEETGCFFSKFFLGEDITKNLFKNGEIIK